MEMSKRTILKSATGAFGARISLVHATEGFEVAGSGTRPTNEKWGILCKYRHGTTGGQWFRTFAEAEAHFDAHTMAIVEIAAQ